MTTDRPASRMPVATPRTFPIAPMSTGIRVLSALLLVIPVAMAIGAAAGTHALLIPFALLATIYSWVWLRFRPRAFVIHPDHLEIVWPLKRREIPRSTIVSCRTLGATDLRREIGWGARVGAGGLWGGFGWLWTRRRGIVQMYVSRTDGFVWIERGRERPWLITPESPDEFVRDVVSGATSLVERGLSSKHGGAVAPNGA